MDIEKMKAYMESPEGKAETEAYIAKMAKEQEIADGRYVRFEKWLETHDFDNLMYRLILEHDDEYRNECYYKGSEPYPNNKLNFVLDYITQKVATITVSELDCDFANSIYFFKGYYIQHIWGQGVITRIYNKDDNKLLLQV